MEIRRHVTIIQSYCLTFVRLMRKTKLYNKLKTVYIKKASPLTPELIQRQIERVELSKIDKLMDVLGIKPGMAILDIGAGSGQYAYKFTERLKGTGKVFATDINIDMINYINEQLRVRNITNLFPVLVQNGGLDGFYKKNKFDLVFVAYTYLYIRERINYFKKLKDSLAKNGRLVFLDLKYPQKFSLGDISDFGGLIKQLSSEEFDSPFYLHLRESTQELLHQPLEDKTKELLRNAIIGDLNRIRDDIHFLSNFLKDRLTFKEDVHFTIEERNFVNWALRFLKLEDKVLDDAGALDINNRNITRKHLFLMIVINTVLIVQKFRQYLYNGKPAPYMPQGYGNWQNSHKIEELTLAGYSLEHKYDFIPFSIILVFTANKSTKGIPRYE